MEYVRGFEVVSKYKDEGVALPKRATKGSAGYDLSAAEDTLVPSLWKILTANEGVDSLTDKKVIPKENASYLGSTLVSTGLKVFMPDQEYLLLANRSSNPMKRQLAVPNGIGVIDSDYYNNENNEGEIFVQLVNYGLEDVLVKKGERIAQGIFTPYKIAEQEEKDFKERSGGFGSSGQ